MDCLHELRGNHLSAEFRQNAVKPVEIDARFELEAQEKAHRAIPDAGDQLQHVITAAKTATNRFHVPRRSKYLIVKLGNDLELLRVVLLDNGVGHGGSVSTYV